MADQIRSVSALQALLADNTTGDISPQDMRDVLVSCTVLGPGMEHNAGYTETLTANTWTKMTGTTTFDDPGNSEFSMSANNRLRNDSANSVTYRATIALVVGFTDPGNNVTVDIAIYKDGSPLPDMASFEGRGNANAAQLVVIHDDDWAPASYYEGWIRSSGTSVGVTIYHMHINVIIT